MTVVIPSRTLANVTACVAAVKQHEPAAQVIVVDDGIGDGKPDGVTYVDGIKPFVYARNCNLGIRAAGDDDVVLLNDDAILKTYGGFSVLFEAMNANSDYGIMGATCNNVGNRNQWPQGKGLRFEPRMVCFVAVAIPRRTINAVGLLDERFIGYGFDDDDYCARVRRAGLKVGIHDGCYVDHGSLVSTYRGNPKAPAKMEQNAAIFKAKWGADNHSV